MVREKLINKKDLKENGIYDSEKKCIHIFIYVVEKREV